MFFITLLDFIHFRGGEMQGGRPLSKETVFKFMSAFQFSNKNCLLRSRIVATCSAND